MDKHGRRRGHRVPYGTCNRRLISWLSHSRRRERSKDQIATVPLEERIDELQDLAVKRHAAARMTEGAWTRLLDRMSLALESLSYREREIVRLRYGLEDDGCVHTLQEIGRRFGVVRERIRAIELKAIWKLQRAARLGRLDE
jgi:RNA polymerase sigma factor (sigma-70 family)